MSGTGFYCFGRGGEVIHLFGYNGDNNAWNQFPCEAMFGDDKGWDHHKYYETLQLASIDHKLYVFGRGSHNIHLLEFDPHHNAWKQLPFFPALGDDQGWAEDKHYKTLRFTAVGHKLYVFGRGHDNVHLFEFDTHSEKWETMPNLPAFADGTGWGHCKYYDTLHVIPVEHKLFVFGRGSENLHLFSFDTHSKTWKEHPYHHALADSQGWAEKAHYATIRVAAIGHEIYVFGRGHDNIHLLSFDTHHEKWEELPYYPAFADSTGWSDPKYYETLRLIPVDHHLFVFGRGSCNLHLFRFDTHSKTWSEQPYYPAMTDEGGWGEKKYFHTIRVVKVLNKIVVVGRGSENVHVITFNPHSATWEEPRYFPALPDAHGWNHERFYETIRAVAAHF